MAGGKRPLTLKTKSSTKESLVEDKETKFEKIEGMDQRSDDDDDGDTSDSSVYSGLEEEEDGEINLILM
jgi:hypothetical protein